MQNAILIVDDDPDDANLIRRVVLGLHPKHLVQTVHSGRDLKACLEGEARYADREKFPYPGLILLDLRMPGMDGFEVMEWLKSHPLHAAIPVIAMSAFDQQKNIRKAYQLGARTFLSKPVHPESIRDAIRALKLPIEFFD
jgi:two-component system, response regulator